jgi:hypothetical protein
MMKTTTSFSLQRILVIFCLVALGNTYSQVKSPSDKTLFGKRITAKNSNPNNGIIRCATVEYEQFLQERNPKRLKEAQFEAWLSPLVSKYKAMRTSSKTAATILTIPVVVHVIHNGQAIGVAPNITDAQVQSQITVLNQDFRKMLGTRGGESTNPVAADIEIEFVLAKADPNGNPTNGIDRVAFIQESWVGRGTDIDLIVKPTTIWDPTQYLNMWTLNISDDILGYAQFPEASGLDGLGSGGTANTDGVISSYDVFGSSDISTSFLLADPYDKGRTMTHEVGHFLGLRHIWGDGNGHPANPTANPPVTALTDCTATDYCDDTPQVGYEHYSCGNFDTCTSAAGNDMVENYMDYTNDACMNIFTKNQKDRILVIMANAARRSSLKTSTKGTAIPIFANDAEVKIETDYSLVNVSDCASLPAPTNKKVALTNRGTSPLTTVTLNYSIAGGANQTQNWTGTLAQNESTIVTLLNTASFGILNVSVGTINGTTDERPSNNTDTKTFGPINYTFTDYVFKLQQDFWGDETTWNLKDAAGVVKYEGGPYTGKHSEILPLPELITENWTLANNQCYTFTIYDSRDDGICCGSGGDGYYKITSTNGLITIASGASYGSIENIQFTTNVLGTNEFETSNDIYLYPNPTKGTLNIQIPSNFGLPNSYVISNVLGQKIRQKEVSKEADLTINTSALSNGIYFITIVKEDQKKTLRFIKE